MLSNDNLRILQHIAALDGKMLPANERPLWMDPWRLESLAEQKLLMPVTIVPPGVEGYVHGLFGWKLTPEGEDALAELAAQAKQKADDDAERQKQKTAEILQIKKQNRQSFKHDLLVGIIVAAVTFSLDHVLDIVDFFKKIWSFLAEFLH